MGINFQQKKHWWQTPGGAALIAGLLAAIIFASTLQMHISGSSHPYATDVGELQNALPRWGTIHFSGYPLYSITGSFIVTILRWVGIAPAMGSSVVSLIWGGITAVFLVLLALELGADWWAAILGAVIFSVSTSMWIDSSMTELHSMSMMFMAGILLFAVRFDRTGNRRDLIWLTIFISQGIFHGRAVLALIPVAGLLILPRWRQVLNQLPLLIGISLIAPALYIYLPLREWMGSDWTFGNTSTWDGFWRMFLNIKAGRFASVPTESAGLQERLQVVLAILHDDLPLPILCTGLAGLFLLQRKGWAYLRYATAISMAWLPYVVVALIIYAGFVGDALLAVKLPVPMLAGVGIAFLLTRLYAWKRVIGNVVIVLTVAAIGYTAVRNYPSVVAITKDRSVESVIAIADQAANPEEPTVMMVQWGHSFWGVAYAQAYRNQLQGVTLVDHNANFQDLVFRQGNRLLTLSETFYLRSQDYWQGKLGDIYLDSYAPGLVEIRTSPRADVSQDESFVVNEDLFIQSATVVEDPAGILLTLIWQAADKPTRDYRIAVHLVAQDPPTGPQDILAQADAAHPVDGWYPTTQWFAGQTVQDSYRLQRPTAGTPTAVRVTAYYVDETNQFVNGNWFVIPLR